MNKAYNHNTMICNIRLRQSQQSKASGYLYFTRTNKILVEELFIPVHGVITHVKARKKCTVNFYSDIRLFR